MGKAVARREPHPEWREPMSLRAWWSRIRASIRRDDALDEEMEREMAFHLEMSARRNRQHGMSEQDALRQAKLNFGSVAAVREEAREAYRARFAENFVNDVRFALRGLRRAPSFSVTSLLSVAL